MTVTADLRNIASIETWANEILKQCAHYRRNCEQGDDSIRFLVLDGMAIKLKRVTGLGSNRWYRAHSEPRDASLAASVSEGAAT